MSKKIKIIFFLIAPISIASFAQYPQLSNLKPGPYQVGFQVLNNYDNSRHVRAKTDFEGKKNDGNNAVPLQVSMWYPAIPASKPEKMLFKEYIYLTSQVNSFKVLTEEEKKADVNSFRNIAKGGLKMELTDTQLEIIANTKTAVQKNLKPQPGKFPVILCGTQGGPSFNSVLYEYLASLGYVVLSTSGDVRTESLLFSRTQFALQERINDLEYLISFSNTLPFADKDKVGLLGVNSNSLSVLLYQMKNMQADAVVSIDGWEGAEGSKQHLLQSPFFEMSKMRVPYFLVKQDESNPPPSLVLSQTVFDTLIYSERYYHVLQGMNHACLVANMGMVPDLPTEKRTAYQFLYSSIGYFFDAYLKKSATALAFIKKPAIENGFTDGMLKSEVKKPAFPPIPTSEELAKLFADKQYEKINTILKEAKRLNPNLNAWGSTLNNQGYSLLRNKKYPEAISIFKLNTELYPQTAGWFDSLAEAYEASGDKENMKSTSQKVLDLLKPRSTLSNNEKSMKEVAEKRVNM